MKLKKILLASFATAALFAGMFTTQSCKNGDQPTEEEMAALQSQYDSIMTIYQNTMADYKNLENLNTDQAKKVDSLVYVIEHKKPQYIYVNNDPNAATQPAQPAQPVQSKSKLQRQINDLQSEVDNLNRIVNDLRAENQRLKEENEKMQVDLEQANGTIATQTSEIADLNQKLVNARTLLINDLTATPEKKKCGKSNKFKSTNKSGSVERISISGKILPNTVVDPGTKTFYARITKGSNLITNLGAEPKTFDMDGVDMLYTAEQDVEFYGQGRNFNMIWRKSNATNLEPGVYTVTVYNAGNEVGKTNFTLK